MARYVITEVAADNQPILRHGKTIERFDDGDERVLSDFNEPKTHEYDSLTAACTELVSLFFAGTRCMVRDQRGEFIVSAETFQAIATAIAAANPPARP